MSLPTGGPIARSNFSGASRISRTGALALIACAWTAGSAPATAQTYFGASDNGFTAFTDNGAPLANPDIAVGSDYIVAIASGELAWYDKNYQLLGSIPLGGVGGLWESVGGTDGIHDAKVIWNPNAECFYVVATEYIPNEKNTLYIAYSLTASPTDGWFTRSDYLNSIGPGVYNPSIGIYGDGIFCSMDFDHTIQRTGSWMFRAPKAQITDRVYGILGFTKLSMSPRSYACNDSVTPTPTQFLALTDDSGAATHLRLVGWNPDVLSGVMQETLVESQWHYDPPPITQPGPPITGVQQTFSSFVVVDGQGWAAHSIKHIDRSIVRWYEIDLKGWPTSGQIPAIRQTGDIDLGSGVHAFLPDIAVDSEGNAAIVFSVSSADQNIAIARAVRFADDPLGEFRQHRVIQASNSVEPSGQWGAYVGIEADPVTPGVFWSHAPYRTDGWRTWVGKITLVDDDIPPSDGPRLDTPDDGFINNVIPVLQWSFNDLASGFRIHVSGNSEFQGDNAYTSDLLVGNSHEIPDGVLECNTRYYWRVVAETPGGDMMSDPESRWFERRLLEDINLDGIVDSSDLGLLISVYNTTAPAADFNGDGIVNSADLGLLLNSFGDVCN